MTINDSLAVSGAGSLEIYDGAINDSMGVSNGNSFQEEGSTMDKDDLLAISETVSLK